MHLVKRTVNRNLYDYVRLRTLQRTLFTHTLHIFLHVLTFLVSLMIPHTLLAPDTPQHEPSTLFFFCLVFAFIGYPVIIHTLPFATPFSLSSATGSSSIIN